ncbi:MAG: hypothetical protein QM796_03430 [Chthoniobacteraceae bacterium]
MNRLASSIAIPGSTTRTHSSSNGSGSAAAPRAFSSRNRFLDRLRFSQKLHLISLAFTIPFIIAVWLLVVQIDSQIAASRLEQDGNAYLVPLDRLLDLVSQRRLVSIDSTADRTALNSQIDNAFADLAQVQKTLGGRLQFTSEGLVARHRERANPSDVQQEWTSLRDSDTRLSSTEVDHLLAQLISDLQLMIAHAVDTSNLVLDTDLDSFYLMDATACALPQAQGRVSDIAAAILPTLQRGRLTMDERVQAAVFETMLKETDLGRINTSTSDEL